MTCSNVSFEVFTQNLFKVQVRTDEIISRYNSNNHYCFFANILINCEDLCGVGN